MKIIADQLWIANAIEVRTKSVVADAGIQAIVDLALDEPPIQSLRDIICIRVPLIDGSENSVAKLTLAIESTHSLLAAGIPCLVACSAGLSRSPLIAAAALCLKTGETLTATLTQIAAQHQLDLSPALLTDVSQVCASIQRKIENA